MPDPDVRAARTVNDLLGELRWAFQAVTPAERARIDRGSPQRIWLEAAPPGSRTEGAGDGRAQDAELLQEAFRELRRVRFGTASLGAEVSDGPGSFLRWFREHGPQVPASWSSSGGTGLAAFLPPWLIDDASSATTADRALRQRLDAVVASATRAVRHSGGNPRTPAGRAALALELQERIHRPSAEGGLGLRYEYSEDRSYRRTDAIEAFQRGAGDCNALSYLYFAMAARAGLNPQFIRISGRRDSASGTMEEIFHIGVAVAVDPVHPETLTPMDPSAQYTIDANWEWFPVTEVEMAAYHLRNLALRNIPEGTSEADAVAWQEYLFRQALALTNNFEILLDAAWFYRHGGNDEARADALTASARAANPTLRAIW